MKQFVVDCYLKKSLLATIFFLSIFTCKVNTNSLNINLVLCTHQYIHELEDHMVSVYHSRRNAKQSLAPA